MPRKSVTEKPIVVSAGGAAAAPARRKSSTPKRVSRNAEPSVAAVAAATVEVSQDEIAKLAYTYWVARGCQGGSPEEDWLRAERELRAGK